jgi:hypothetical protein
MARMKRQRRSLPSFAWLARLRVPQWPTVRRAVIAILWLGAVAGFVAGATYGMPLLEARAAERHRPESIEVHFRAAPEWFAGDVQQQVLRTIEAIVGSDALSRQDLIAVREGLFALGWFADIAQVRRVHAERIEIDAVFLQPYAVVRDRRGDHLVDPHGRLLPRTFRTGESGFVAIVGAAFDRPQRAGNVWEGADVAAALQVLRLVQSQPWRRQVVEVDVAGHMGGRAIRFITDRGSRIVWGSAPGEEGALESLATWKLHYLNHLQKTFGHIDMGHSGEVDITSTRTIDQR